MMGRGHATTGALMWAGASLAAVPYLDTPLLAPVASAPLVALVVLGAAPVSGASLIPDIDHTNGTIANSMGSFTKLLTKVVSVISGGHRQATHGIWFWFLMTGLAFGIHFAAVAGPDPSASAGAVMAAWSWVVTHGDLLTFFVLTAFGQRALGAKWLNKILAKVWRSATGAMVRVVFFVEAALLTGLAMWVWPEPEQWIWLPFAVSIGHFSHLVADSLTTAGVQWLWPSRKTVRLPIVGDAGSKRETWLSLAFGVGFVALAVRALLP